MYKAVLERCSFSYLATASRVTNFLVSGYCKIMKVNPLYYNLAHVLFNLIKCFLLIWCFC